MSDVLIIAPHADDEILGVGGTIQKHIHLGDVVSVAIVCDRKGDLSSLREESKSALEQVGVTRNIYYIGMADEWLDDKSRPVIKEIDSVYMQVSPEIVYYPHHGDVNTDHKMVNRACGVICRPDGWLKQIHLYEVPSSTTHSQYKTFNPNHYTELTEEQVDNKIKAMQKYKSEIRSYPNARSISGINAYANFRGMECGHKYAEAFQCIMSVY
jgi:LmbE family N-acetylglucosaminyl deacetylase